MARYAYKCSKCRRRNMFRRLLEDYLIPRRCKDCGHDRFYWDKERNRRTFVARDDVCYCQSPYQRPHRRGSKWCQHNPDSELHIRTDLQGETRASVLAGMAFEPDGGGLVTEEAPF